MNNRSGEGAWEATFYSPTMLEEEIPRFSNAWCNHLSGEKVSLASEACHKESKGQGDGDVRIERPGVGVSMLVHLSVVQKKIILSQICSLSGIPYPSPSPSFSQARKEGLSISLLLPHLHLHLLHIALIIRSGLT